MIGPNLVADDIDIDGGSFFDHIDDLLDFPEDNENELPGKNGDSFPSIWTSHPDAFPGSDLLFSANNNSNCTSDLSTELSVPYEDIVQLEWLSNFVEDSFSGGSLTFSKEECHDNNKQSSSQNQFRTSSPVSVLESSSSCSGEKPAIVTFAPKISARGRCGRARSKRPRPATFIPRHAIQLISPASSITETSRLLSPSKTSSESENFAESHPIVKRKKKMKMSPPLSRLEGDQNHPPPAAHTVRKCMHCEITKTPQWRAGPMGPKTLCNACGVRYKSGRLFPEYRPAASPTFLPSVHSNSHKKVLEMRKQEGGNAAPTLGIVATHEGETKSIIVSPPELIPNNNPLLGYI